MIQRAMVIPLDTTTLYLTSFLIYDDDMMRDGERFDQKNSNIAQAMK